MGVCLQFLKLRCGKILVRACRGMRQNQKYARRIRAKRRRILETMENIPELTDSTLVPVADSTDTRYNRSITARLMQADDTLKRYYSELKNELLSYQGVRCSIAWKQEMFKYKWQFIAKILLRGKTLCLFLNLDLANYEGSTYKVEDMSDKAISASTPVMYRIKNERRLRLAKELIADAAKRVGVTKGEQQHVDYAAELQFMDDDSLVEAGLSKLTAQTQYDAIMKKD
jgi:hypothetical protein